MIWQPWSAAALRARPILGLLVATCILIGAASPAAADAGVVRHSATVSADNALIAEVRVSLDRAARVYVEYDHPRAGRYRTALSEAGAEHTIPIVRLRPDTTYDYTIFVADSAGGRDAAAGPGGNFTTGALPPPLTSPVRVTGRSSQPLVLADYRHVHESGTEYFVLHDEAGGVVWYAREGNSSAIDRLPGGNWVFLNEGYLTEMTPLGEVVNRFAPRGQWGNPHHEVTVLDDGRVIYPSRKVIIFDDSANGGIAETKFRVDDLRVWDRASGRVERVWDAGEAWDVRDPNQMAPGYERRRANDSPITWVHLNSVSIGPRGNVILSFRHRNQVISLSPDFRTIEWQLNGPDSDYEFPNPADRFYAQHTAAQLANGNVLVFDNGWMRPEAEGGEYSRVLELRLDATAGTAVKVWEYRPDPDIYSSALGSAYRLRNGNTLVRFGIRRLTDRPLLVAEVDAAGNEVFRLEHWQWNEPRLRGYRAYGGITSIMGETMLRPPAALRVGGTSRRGAQEAAGGHPSDPWFAPDHVLDVAVEMAPADWDQLRRQTRTWGDAFGGTECLAQPFAQVFSWFAADVTVDGQRYGEVGVRKKGFLGSLSEEKPSLKIGFDKFTDDQALGGVLRRLTLNNSLQDPSLLNTCMAYQVFAAAGLPAPRCNYARVAVNGEPLGLYVHVEDIERSLLERAFADAGGNLYEGTVSDFRPEFRGTIDKKTNRDAGDWSDVDAVVAALQDPSPAGLRALDAAVDLDQFLTFWAAEVLVGHWDGYAGDRNNFYVYREPAGRFTFIPWGADDTFRTTDNPFDDFVSPPSVMAHGAIAHRLYGDSEWRARYVARLRQLLDTVWDEAELLRHGERMAAIVQTHALPERRAEAAADADRVRRYIRGRRAEIVADLQPAPPDWPWPLAPAEVCMGEPTVLELWFKTTWGTKEGADPFVAGAVTRFLVDGAEQPVGNTGATAGMARPDEAAQMGVEEAAVVTLMTRMPDFSIDGITAWLPPGRAAAGARLAIGEQGVGGAAWSLAPGAAEPKDVIPIISGRLELDAAGTRPGAVVSGRFYGTLWGVAEPDTTEGEDEPATAAPGDSGLVINEVAARGEPRDWFELYNASDEPLPLAGFVFADDLTDRGKRTPFPESLIIEPGAYLRIELDSDGWPGFALGRDEELGIWSTDGDPVAQVDWQRGDSDDGMSYARVPDVTGPFQTVTAPTPGAPNAAP